MTRQEFEQINQKIEKRQRIAAKGWPMTLVSLYPRGKLEKIEEVENNIAKSILLATYQCLTEYVKTEKQVCRIGVNRSAGDLYRLSLAYGYDMSYLEFYKQIIEAMNYKNKEEKDENGDYPFYVDTLYCPNIHKRVFYRRSGFYFFHWGGRVDEYGQYFVNYALYWDIKFPNMEMFVSNLGQQMDLVI